MISKLKAFKRSKKLYLETNLAALDSWFFSINLLTLFAIVLCIGIVVDDAIVVVEGVAKKVERGKKQEM